MTNKQELPQEEQQKLLMTLKQRFDKHMNRHKGIEWAAVQARLEKNPAALWSLAEMEETAGEPDVIGRDEQTGEYIFCDCSAESPKGRRSICYDADALESRKEHKPKHSAQGMAREMGIRLLNEAEYRDLQKLEPFDTKTSSWLETPAEIRERGGAIFGDRRYDTVFMYHNGAESYYGARAFRGLLKV
ncbi:DUF4256 domain-containing protein [Pedobacter sp. SYP-B3415]|uniref:DUF4256 domain-containing protein n=1 Tax=Pedobacter sp. SYP-B3415 TaxID=2496641 RepID=UPI00101BF9BB|nr:DUF4256 domain-containing protein [Pedobacter sp. SYP-B3415]